MDIVPFCMFFGLILLMGAMAAGLARAWLLTGILGLMGAAFFLSGAVTIQQKQAVGDLTAACREIVAQNTKPDLVASCKPHLLAVEAQEALDAVARQAAKDKANEAAVRKNLQSRESD